MRFLLQKNRQDKESATNIKMPLSIITNGKPALFLLCRLKTAKT